MKYEDFKIHPAADLFPLMDGEEFDELAADIKEHGLLEAIVMLAGTNELVDGRNRLRACLEAGVKPVFDAKEISDPFAYVVSKNLKRRHLTAEQRRAIVAKLREQGMSVRKIAETTGIPKTTVARDVSQMGQVPETVTGTDRRIRQQSPHRQCRSSAWCGSVGASKAVRSARSTHTRI